MTGVARIKAGRKQVELIRTRCASWRGFETRAK